MAVNTPKADEADISSRAFWSHTMRERDETFALLRRERPVSFHPPAEGGLIPPEHGFWALVRRAEVVHVSTHPDLFCSSRGVSFEDVPPELNEAAGSFLVMDDPRHMRLRRLVSRAFTPRNIAKIDEQISRQAAEVVADAVAGGGGDVVDSIAMRLPLYTISEMMGIPPERRESVFQASNVMVGTNDPDFVPPGESGMAVLAGAMFELTTIARELAAERRDHPQDDLMTALVQAEVDGERLTDEQIGAFFVLLSVAGNDTTRNTISHGIHAFGTNPDQWELLRTDPEPYLPDAVEELVRWASPVMTFRRTATGDMELAGQRIAEGDRVVLFYTSANRDESVFDEPWRFDITRHPNEHVGFGGGGPHFCMGANLARTQLRAVFRELAARVRSFDVDEPEYLVGNFIHGVKRLNCRYEPVAA